jgi:hypothetical protein
LRHFPRELSLSPGGKCRFGRGSVTLAEEASLAAAIAVLNGDGEMSEACIPSLWQIDAM